MFTVTLTTRRLITQLPLNTCRSHSWNSAGFSATEAPQRWASLMKDCLWIKLCASKHTWILLSKIGFSKYLIRYKLSCFFRLLMQVDHIKLMKTKKLIGVRYLQLFLVFCTAFTALLHRNTEFDLWAPLEYWKPRPSHIVIKKISLQVSLLYCYVDFIFV